VLALVCPGCEAGPCWLYELLYFVGCSHDFSQVVVAEAFQMQSFCTLS